MNITQKKLKDWSACTDGYKWACGILNNKPMEVKKFLKITSDHRLDWANWVIVRVMTYDQYVSYAVYAAEQVIDIYEKEYPNDKRPRLAIEAAKKCIGLKGAARDAARAAGDAARDAAGAAAWAAGAAAWAAAWADARADARAAGAAAQKQMQIKILEYGLSLLE